MSENQGFNAVRIEWQLLEFPRGARVLQGIPIQYQDRVEVTGLRPSPLPHHRTSGFPHPAVGPGDLTCGREIRWNKEPVAVKGTVG